MALKDFIAAGDLGRDLAAISKELASLSNRFNAADSPLQQLLAKYKLSSDFSDDPDRAAALTKLLEAASLPSEKQYGEAAALFDKNTIAEANTVISACRVAAFVLEKLAAQLPANDV